MGAALAVGSVHIPVILVVSATATLAAVLTVYEDGLPGGRIPGIAWVAALLAIYSVVQAVPLPFGLLARLSPQAADVWARALLPVGESKPAFASLSLDPGASFVEALKWWTYALTLVSAVGFGARRGIATSALVVVGSSLVVALCTLGHGLVGASRVFGVYSPVYFSGAGWGIGPLLNPNNLASYLNLGAIAGVGLVAARPPPLPRWIVAIVVASLVAVSVNTGSRGGLVSLVAAALLLTVLLRDYTRSAMPEPNEERRGVLLGLGLTAAGAVAFSLLASTSATAHLLADRNVKKLQVAVATWPMMKDFPWFGVGRGAFESAFPAYRLSSDNTVYSHPENFIAQWLTEWGLPVGMALLGAFGWLLRPQFWGVRKSAAACGLFAAFIGFFIQNLVDLGTETTGVAIMVWAVAGMVWGHNHGAVHVEAEEESPRGWMRSLGVPLAGTVALFACTAAFGLHTIGSDRFEVAAARPSDFKDPLLLDAFDDALKDAIRRHPADPFFPREGAVVAMRGGHTNPVPWIQRALERGMTSGRTHYLVAALLGARGVRHQSLLELKLAVTYEPGRLARAAGALAVRMTKARDELMLAVPEGAEGASMLQNMAGQLPRGYEDLSFRLLEQATERAPEALSAQTSLVHWLLRDLEVEGIDGRCGGERRLNCQKTVLEHIRQIAAVEPNSQDPLQLEARLLLVAGHPAAAVRLLGQECPRVTPRNGCMMLWLHTVAGTRDMEELHRVAKLVERDGCSDAKACAATDTAIGDVLSRVQNAEAALQYYERAANDEPTAQHWRRVGQVAAAVGAHAEAVRAYGHASQFGDADSALRHDLDYERLRALTDTLPKK